MVVSVARRHKITDFQDYIRRISVADAVEGRFLLKVSIAHIVLLVKTGVLDRIKDQASFIHVDRADKLSQAISLSIASQTRKWASFVDVQSAPPVYHSESIAEFLRHLLLQSSLLEEFFAFNGIVPYRANYEQLVDRTEIVIRQLASRLGVDEFELVPENVRTERQSDEINEQWRASFLAEVAGD